MVSRVSVPFPEILLWSRGKAKYGTGRNKPLTSRSILYVIGCYSTGYDINASSEYPDSPKNKIKNHS